MPLTQRLPHRAVVVAALTAGLLVGSAVSASATAHEDPRAEIGEGNATTCEHAGLDGDLIDKGVLTYEGGKHNVDQYVTITDVPGNVTVTGIVVKGGDRHNVYEPGKRGLPTTPPWTDLRSPLNKGGNIPAISHWYVCGVETTTTTTTSTTTTETSTTETTTSETSTTTSESSSTETTTSESGDTATTTTTSSVAGGAGTSTSAAPVSPAGDSGDLASTGFGGAWLIGLGALLLVGGGVLVFLTRMRRSS
ncbi:hypothetical protein FCN18_37605 [Prauserella endophytica]|uniref:LPXTG cell wall anchor domain-containing protein n=1 Tax=Prauserella endophytica TaxID=1592324 RepID=A0ABY2RTZ2_9PSEU|nr:hypothetical protein FCN18_37605 [Prauserella endophytica]